MPIRPCLSCAPSVGFDECAVYQFGWWNAQLSRARIQAATHCKTLTPVARDVPAIDANGWRAKKFQLASHCLVADKNFVNLCGDTLCGEGFSHQLHRCRVRGAI